MTTVVLNITPQSVYADENNTVNEIIEESVVRTTLSPNTSQDWAIAYKDGIVYPSFFHNKVEADIRKKNGFLERNEMTITGAGRYGTNGRVDLYFNSNGLIYIWDVKPASNGYFPSSAAAVKQVENYVAADEDYRIGLNTTIKNGTFEVTIPSSGVKYNVTYSNSLYNDGLIFYRFDRVGKPEQKPVEVTVTEEERNKVISKIVDVGYVTEPTIVVDWGKVNAFVAIATTITAAGIALNSDSVQKTLVACSATFLSKLGGALAKVGTAAGVATIGSFANAQVVMAAEQNPENADLQAVNDAVDEYETALEVLLGLDSIDELLDAYNQVDEDEIDEMIKGIQNENEEYEDASEAQPPRDPLIIDLKTVGIELCSLTEGVNFDLDNNGYAEKTAWIGTEDGFLALDRDGNGTIDNGGELFGDQVDIGGGILSSSGFEALSMLDSNNDKIIDSQDDCYSKLLVWVDSNHNGYSEANELNSMSYYEIREIELSHTEESVVDESTGTMLAETAKVIYQNDLETTISEFWFPVNSSDTTHGDVITAGNVPSIEQAIEDDETGELALLVGNFVEAENIASRKYYLKKILYFITDSNDIAINSRGGNIDARDLHVIEQFMGRNFNGVGGTNPNSNAANILKNVYKDIENYYYCVLSLYAEFGGYKTLMIEFQDENGNDKLNVTCLVYMFETLIAQGEDMETLIYDLGVYMRAYDKFHNTNYYEEYCEYYSKKSDDIIKIVNATNESNTYIGTKDADYYYGSSLKEYIFGEAGNDSLYGGAGVDYLIGSAGNDCLDGGTGNDTISGGIGNDTYVFAKGYGVDTITDNNGSNVLSFSNLNAKDVLVNGTGEYDVTIRIKGTNDMLIIKDFRKNQTFADYKLVFKDKTMHCTDEESPFMHIYGSDLDDILKAVVDGSMMNAYGGNDTVIGSKGKEVIYGNSGNDSITAGEENDIIYGGADNDTINAENGDDIVWGEAGNDILDGGAGNDYLFGGIGDDTYIFAEKYGKDILEDGKGISTIKLGDGLTLEDISIYHIGNEALICVKKTDNMLIISEYGACKPNYFIEAAGTKMSIEDVIIECTDTKFSSADLVVGTDESDAIFAENVENIIVSGAQYDYIVGGRKEDIIFGDDNTDRVLAGTGNEIIYGGKDNDQLYGEDDNDFINGGDGNDYINGGNGDDVIISGIGNDFIEGCAGNDIYYFNTDDGNDSIMDSEGNNVIIFGDGICPDGVKVYRDDWNDLLITFEGLNDTLIIKNYCIDEKSRNFKVVYADGSVYDITDKDNPFKSIRDISGAEYMPSIYTDGITIVSTNGNDQLIGSEAADTLIGGDESNRILGNAGDDSLDGGKGQDYLNGGMGSDTYIYKKGYGADTFSDSQGTNYIEISGYTVADVKAYRTNWNDMTLVFGESDESAIYDDSVDKIILEGFFATELCRNYYISFSGSRYYATAGNSPLRRIYGTVNGDYMQGFDSNNVTIYGGEGADTLNGANAGDVLTGGEGNDRLLGFAGNDILNGEAGNDYLEGGADNDTYIFGLNSGVDTISDNQGVNTISVGQGLSKNDIVAYRTNWNDLTITFEGVDDSIIIQGYFTSENSRKFDIIFSDGSKFEYTNLESPINLVYASDNDDWISAWSDKGIALNGGAGNDHLTGGAGNDILIGANGNDYLMGGVGDDIYRFGLGYGNDTINDSEGLNKICFEDISSKDIAFVYKSSDNSATLIMTSNSADEIITINGYCEDNFEIAFSDGVIGKVTILDGIPLFVQVEKP